MGEPWKTKPLPSSVEMGLARHEVMCAVEQAHPGLLRELVERAADGTQKYGLDRARALNVVASVVAGVTGALPSLDKYFAPFRKGRS